MREATVPPRLSGLRSTRRDPDAGRIRLSNTVFANAGAAVLCASSPGRLEIDNCLKIGGALFDLRDWPTGRDLTVSARHLTLRNGESFCRVQLSKTRGRNAQVRAALDESVFDLAGRQAALLLVTSNKVPFGRDIPMVVTGRGSVIRTNVPILAWVDRAAPERSAIELSSAVVEGLAVGEFQFIGKSGLAVRDSALDGRSLQIPRRSDVPPGIVADRLHFAQTPAALEAEQSREARSAAACELTLRVYSVSDRSARDDHFRSRPGMLSATLVPLAGSGLSLTSDSGISIPATSRSTCSIGGSVRLIPWRKFAVEVWPL